MTKKAILTQPLRSRILSTTVENFGDNSPQFSPELRDGRQNRGCKLLITLCKMCKTHYEPQRETSSGTVKKIGKNAIPDGLLCPEWQRFAYFPTQNLSKIVATISSRTA